VSFAVPSYTVVYGSGWSSRARGEGLSAQSPGGHASTRRVLVVTPDAAGPPDQGFRIRVHYLATALVAGGFQVVLVAGPTDPSAEDELRRLGVDVIAAHGQGRPAERPAAVRQAVAMLLGRPSGHLAEQARLLRPTVTRLMRERTFDAVQVEFPDLVACVAPYGVPVVYDAHNVWSELDSRRDRLFRSRASRAVAWIGDRRRRSSETWAWRVADLCLATSSRDAGIISAGGAAAVAVIPNGVDLERIPDTLLQGTSHGAATMTTPLAKGVVFVGLLAYRPNADAVMSLVREVLPLLEAKYPDVQVTIVGKGAPESLLRSAGPRVTFTGRVDDPLPYLADADAVVVPLRVGSGTRLKILEALALGRPVVTTSIGAEGLDLVHGQHALIADDPAALAAEISRVFEDSGLADALGRNGRGLVEESFSWRTIGSDLVRAYERLLESAP
jgi:glycosyltransferase involved in cell wall biosynthesis